MDKVEEGYVGEIEANRPKEEKIPVVLVSINVDEVFEDEKEVK